MRVAANEAKQLLRKRRTRARFEVTTDASEEPGGRDPATGVTGLDLREAMSRLAPDDRALLAMRFIAGFDSNELAAATGISPSGPAAASNGCSSGSGRTSAMADAYAFERQVESAF